MANFVNTKPEVLRSVADSISSYPARQTEVLQTCLLEISSLVGEIEVKGFEDCISEIRSMLSQMEEHQQTLQSFSSILMQKASELESVRGISAPAGSTQTFRQKAAGIRVGISLGVNVAAAGSDSKSVGGYILKTAKAVGNVVLPVVEGLTGVTFSPPMAPSDSAVVDGQIDGLLDLVDGHLASKPGGAIRRDPSPVPQEQIHSHTLIVSDPNAPWEDA